MNALKRKFALSLMRLARKGKPRQDGRAPLLAQNKRGGEVILVWLLGPLKDDYLAQIQNQLAGAATVVIVSDGFDFRPSLLNGWNIEALPNAQTQAPAANDRWALYLERRIDRIRRDWDPDLEMVAGALSPDEFLKTFNTEPKKLARDPDQ